MCDACDRQLDRRRFLRHLVTGGVIAATGLLWEDAAEAASPFEALPRGEERLPKKSAKAAAAQVAAPSKPENVAAPHIITRAEWGADESIRTSGRAFAPIRKLVVHHSASGNSPSNPASVVRDLYRFHVVDRGYADVGYNFVIDHRGNLYEGRWARDYAPGELHDGEDPNGLGVMGAHAEGVNAGSCGVVLLGNFTSTQPTRVAMNALIRLLAWKAARHRIDAWKSETYIGLFGTVRQFPNITPHRSVGFTICPGNGVAKQMDAVRGSVSSLAGSFPAQTVDMSKAVQYHNLPAITLDTPSGNDVRPKTTTPTTTTTSGALGTLVGYRVLSTGGNLNTLGPAQKFGSPASRGATSTVAISYGPQQSYWTVDKQGNVLAFGGATAHGSMASTSDRTPAVDLAATRAGDGYWILTSAGAVWPFGSATWLGSVARTNPGVGAIRMHATPSGKGYWILGADGGMYAYGDATWYGSAAKSGAPGAVDFWPTPSGKGYWVLTAAGRVLAFGDAVRKGGMSDLGVRWTQPAVALLGAPDGRGYQVLSIDGGVFAFGSAAFFGSLAGSGRSAIGIAPALK